MKHKMIPMTVAGIFCLFVFTGCDKDNMAHDEHTPEHKNVLQLEIGLDDLVSQSAMYVTVTPRSSGGYTATAKGRGTIPSGEYAGWRFTIDLEGYYTGIGFATLESGSAIVRMRNERFESRTDPFYSSFCCGNGHLFLEDDIWTFVVHGVVRHTTADDPHDHLFAGLATTAGTMNMNIADQTGTVVEPADPPHDPGIDLITGFNGAPVRVIPD